MRKLGHACTALETAIQFSANFLTMIAIITCAGRGTRRRPDTEHTPKILLEHAGQPLIDHIVRPIDESGLFDKIVFVLSPRTGNQIIDYVRRNPFDTPHTYVWQHEPLGFGHAVLQARDEVFSWRRRNPPVLVHTDDAVNSHLREGASLIKQITSKETSTLGTQWRGNVRDHGMVVLREVGACLLYTSPSPRDRTRSRMPSSA